MTIRPVMLIVPLLGLVLAFLAPDQPREMAKKRRGRGGAGAAAANPYGSWGSAFRLEKHAKIGAEWAGEALKRGSERRAFLKPFTVVPGDPAAAARIVERDYGKALTLLGAKDPAARAALATRIAGHVLAVYDPETGSVHVLAENARKAAEAAGDPKLMSESVLKLLLVRMGIVALQRQHVPEWKAALDAAADLDALASAAAVFQGRAMTQTRRAAGVMNQQDSSFSLGTVDDLVKLLTAPAPQDASKDLTAFVTATKFALLEGEKFMAGVPRKFHEDVLKQPPTKRAVIFDPASFTEKLREVAARGPVDALPGKVHAAFVKGAMAEGEWKHESETLAAEGAEAMLAPLQKRYYSTAMASFLGGWVTHSLPADARKGPDTDVILIEMRSDGQAEGLLNLLRGAAKERGGSLDDGAGRDLGLVGFHGKETVDGETWYMQFAAEGRFVVGFRTTEQLTSDEAREPWDEMMEAAAEDVAKVAGSRDSRRRRKGR